jgi:hypothetical protein
MQVQRILKYPLLLSELIRRASADTSLSSTVLARALEHIQKVRVGVCRGVYVYICVCMYVCVFCVYIDIYMCVCVCM